MKTRSVGGIQHLDKNKDNGIQKEQRNHDDQIGGHRHPETVIIIHAKGVHRDHKRKSAAPDSMISFSANVIFFILLLTAHR